MITRTRSDRVWPGLTASASTSRAVSPTRFSVSSMVAAIRLFLLGK